MRSPCFVQFYTNQTRLVSSYQFAQQHKPSTLWEFYVHKILINFTNSLMSFGPVLNDLAVHICAKYRRCAQFNLIYICPQKQDPVSSVDKALPTILFRSLTEYEAVVISYLENPQRMNFFIIPLLTSIEIIYVIMETGKVMHWTI